MPLVGGGDWLGRPEFPNADRPFRDDFAFAQGDDGEGREVVGGSDLFELRVKGFVATNALLGEREDRAADGEEAEGMKGLGMHGRHGRSARFFRRLAEHADL